MPAFEEYRQQIGKLLGAYHTGLAQVDPSGSTSTLLDANTLKSTLNIDSLFDDYYLLRPDAANANDILRIVETYSPVSGTITTDRPYTSAVSTEQYELHGIVEPWTDMQDVVNESLKRIYLEVEFTFTAVADQTRHSLASAASWLEHAWQVRQVGYLTSSEDRNKNDPFASRIVKGHTEKISNIVYLVHPGRTFSTSDTMYVKAVARAYDYCRASSSGGFGDRQGLAAEAHEAIPDVNWVAYGAIIEVWNRFSHLLSARGASEIMLSQQKAAARFTDLNNSRFQMPARTFRPMISVGGPGYTF